MIISKKRNITALFCNSMDKNNNYNFVTTNIILYH